MTEVVWTEPVVDDLAKIDVKTAKRIQPSVRRFASDHEGDVKKLAAQDDMSRLRVGDFRVIYVMSRGEVTVLRVLKRARAYRE